MTSVASTVPAILRNKTFGDLPFGSVTITPDKASFFHEPEETIVGVFPRHAHVRWMKGRSERPVSS